MITADREALTEELSMTMVIDIENGTHVDTERYERVALVDLVEGDVILLPETIVDGEVLSWSIRGYTVESVEEKAPGVFFIWRPADAFPPKTTYDRFMMVCGSVVDAGVLRVRRAPKTVHVVILIRHDGTTEESPVHFTDKCSDPVIDKYCAMPHRTVGGQSRQMAGASCTTCGESI